MSNKNIIKVFLLVKVIMICVNLIQTLDIVPSASGNLTENYLSFFFNDEINNNINQLKEEIKDDFNMLVVKLFLMVSMNSNKTIMKEHIFNNVDCYKSLNSLITETADGKKKLGLVLNNSGKSNSDIGLEEDCISTNNLSYIFINYTLNNSFAHQDPIYYNLYQFLEQDTFFTGICLWKECEDFYKSFLNPNENKIFFDTIQNSMGVLNMTIYRMNYMNNKEREIEIWENPKMKFLIICVWLFLIYFSFRVIITFLGYILYEMNTNEDNNCENISLEISESNDPTFSQFTESKKINLLTRSNEINKKEGLFYKVFKIFSLKRGFEVLYKKKTKNYDENNMEILSGLRFYLFFCLTYRQNFSGMTTLPHRDISAFSYYSSFWFFLIKYSSNIFHCYASLNGFYLGFKIMNYIKNNDNKLTIKNLLIFYLKSFPPLTIFLFSFLFLNLYVKEFGYLMKNLTVFDYYVDTFLNSKLCVNNPDYIFYPFYLQYFNIDCDFNKICFNWVFFILSEFYCFTLFLVLVYVLLKIKSKKLDILIYVFNILNLIFSCFSFSHDLINKYYTINNIYGEINTIKYPHLFFIPYFLGINTGIMWFYFKDTTSNNPVSTEDNYHLFYFNFYFMRKVDKLSYRTKLYLIILILFLKILLCLNFYIFLKFFSSAENNLKIKGNYIIEIFYIYEGNLFNILFLIVLICVLFNSKDFSIKKIFASKLFIIMNRISYSFLFSHNFIILFFYSLYNIQIYLNFQNAFFMTMALFFIIIIFSIFTVILIEQPIKLILSSFIRYICKRKILRKSSNYFSKRKN